MNEPSKRIFIFDFIRGLAIIFVILLHVILFNWTSPEEILEGNVESTPFVKFLYFFITMAGTFFIINGCVNGFSMYNRIKKGRNTSKELILGGVFTWIVLIMANFILRFFLSGEVGIIPMFIRTGKVMIPSGEPIIRTTTLMGLAWNSLLIPIVMTKLFKKDKVYKNQIVFKYKVYVKLVIISLLILFITPFIRYAYIDDVINMQEKGNNAGAFFLGLFVYEMFPIFPYIAYGLLGIVIGVAIARQESREFIHAYCGYFGSLLILIGFMGMVLTGGMDPNVYSKITLDAMLNKEFMHIAQIGCIHLWIGAGLWWFDYVDETRHQRHTYGFSPVKRFSYVTFTIFMLEGILSGIVVNIIDLIPGADIWHDSLGLSFLVGILMIVIWHIIIIYWEKYDYKWSLDWMVIKGIERSSGKKSDKLKIKQHSVNLGEIPEEEVEQLSVKEPEVQDECD